MRLPSAATLLLSLAAAAVRAQPQIALGPDIIDDGNTNVVTDIQHAPGDSDRLFVVFRDGRIRILRDFTGENGAYDDDDFLNIGDSGSNKVHDTCGECGLLGLAFHPNYDGGTTNGYFYVNYMRNSPLRTVIARYSVSTLDSNLADVGSELPLQVIGQTYSNHNGGQIQFGPCTGLTGRANARTCLYIGMGDGGSGGDPDGAGQNPNTRLGKMLRFDVDDDGESWTAAGNPGLAALPTPFFPDVWAYGLRNPWRFSFDRDTDDMFIADVGQNAWEEVHFQGWDSTGGENYGWKFCEGLSGFSDATDSDCAADGGPPSDEYVTPIFDYPHTEGRSLTGGYVYRGSAYPDLNGVYIYGDYVSNWIRGAVYNVVSQSWDWSHIYFPQSGLRPTTFGQDANGELYVGRFGGAVHQVRVPTPPTPPPTTSPTTSQQPSKRTPEPTSSPTANPSSSPSKSPITLGVSCPVPPDHTRVLLDGELVLHYSILEDPTNPSIGGIFCARLELNRVAWIGFGRQVSAGAMQGDVAILHYESGAWVAKKYTLVGTNQSPVEMPTESQTLFDVDFDPNPSSKTYFEFTKFLTEANELPYAADGSNRVLFAVGKPSERELAQHSTQGRGALVLDLTPCPALPCDGGQECQQPACATCDGCSETNCGSPSSGCTWTPGGLPCSGGNRCSACDTETSCQTASCNWKGNSGGSCKGGSQVAIAGECTGTVDASEWVCPANPTPGTDSPTTSPSPPTESPTKSPSAGPTAGPISPPTAPPTQTPTHAPVHCGDGTCDAADGEDACSCPSDCTGPCVTDSPTTGPTQNPTHAPTTGPIQTPTHAPVHCGDGTCDAADGEDACSCPSDCGPCITDSPTTSPTQTSTPGCVGGNPCSSQSDCCGAFKCKGPSPKTCKP